MCLQFFLVMPRMLKLVLIYLPMYQIEDAYILYFSLAIRVAAVLSCLSHQSFWHICHHDKDVS